MYNSRWQPLPAVKGQQNCSCGCTEDCGCASIFVMINSFPIHLHSVTKWPLSHGSCGHPIITSKLPLISPTCVFWFCQWIVNIFMRDFDPIGFFDGFSAVMSSFFRGVVTPSFSVCGGSDIFAQRHRKKNCKTVVLTVHDSSG